LPCGCYVDLLTVFATQALRVAVFADEVSAAGAAVPINFVDAFPVWATWL
jgi:hypothetical protein